MIGLDDHCGAPRAVLPFLIKHSAIGRHLANGAVEVLAREMRYFVLHGPYWRLPQGQYRLRLRGWAGAAAMPVLGLPVLGMEVLAQNRVLVAWRDITAAELAGGDVELDFPIPAELAVDCGADAPFEFRVAFLGQAAVRIDAMELVRLAPVPLPAQPLRWRLLGRMARYLNTRAGAFAVRGWSPAGPLAQQVRPQMRLPLGRYRLELRGRARGRPGVPVLGVEVFTAEFGVHAWLDATAEELAAGAVLRFDVPEHMALERGGGLRIDFRVLHFGGAAVTLSAMDLAQERGADPLPPLRWRLGSSGRAGMLRLAPGTYRLSAETGARAGLAWLPPWAAWVGLKPLPRATPLALRDAGAGAVAFDVPAPAGRREAWVQVKGAGGVLELMAPAIIGVARRRLVIIGNCQAELLCEGFRSVEGLNAKFAASYHPAHLQPNLHDIARAELRGADVVLLQAIREVESYKLHDDIPAAAERIELPLLWLAALWPFDSWTGLRDHHAHAQDAGAVMFQNHDGLLARLRTLIPDPEARFEAYRRLDVPDLPNFVRLQDFERRRLLAQDARYGFDIGAYMVEHFRARRLFHSSHHPGRAVFEMLLHWLTRRLELDAPRPSVPALDQLGNDQVPVHPLVAQALGVEWARADTRYLFRGRPIDWEGYVRLYIRHYG
jgi:hypothetical protein